MGQARGGVGLGLQAVPDETQVPDLGRGEDVVEPPACELLD